VLTAPALAAQTPSRPLSCDGKRISEINIVTKSPYPNGVFRRWRALARLVLDTHVRTRAELVQRFLAFHEGQDCSELRRAESERILRAQPFLANATVLAIDDGRGGVRIDVVTVDEIAIVADVGVKAPLTFTKLALGNANLSGAGIYTAGSWQQGNFYRDAYGIRFIDYQLFGRAQHLELNGERHSIGGEWTAQTSHPFFTDLQRAAWRSTIGGSRSYYSAITTTGRTPAVGVDWSFADVGGIIRIGVPGRLSLFGASLSRERSDPDDQAVYITPTGLLDAAPTKMDSFTVHRSARINALWGVRNLNFLRVRGFDALNGIQDLRRGFQLGTLFGRSLAVLGSRDDDIFVAAELYGGNGSDRVFTAFQIQGEGRQNYDRNRWDGIMSSGRAALYVKPSPVHTLVASAEYGVGWHQLVPFQLSIGEPDGGVRGYGAARVAGSQRIVFRGEERWFWGRPWDVADAGLAVFSDVGRIWAGDAPLGEDSYWRSSVGVGLLAGIPSGSRRMWRLDFALPLSHLDKARLEFRIGNRDQSRTFWREPEDMRRSHGRLMPTSVFNWP
jgi:hypothetical protein